MVNSINSMLYNLEVLNKKNAKVTYSLSSGEALEKGSDDSKLFNSILEIKNSINTYSNIQKNISTAVSFGSISDKTVSTVKDMMESINSEILTALNSTSSSEDKLAISNQIESYKDSIFSFLNTKSNNQSLFSGEDISSQAFVKDENRDIKYNGSLTNRVVNVDKNNYIKSGVTGFELIYYKNAEANSSESLTFSSNETILDEDGNEWEMVDSDLDGVFDGLYENGDLSSTPIGITNNSDGTYSFTNTTTSSFSSYHNYFDDLDELISALRYEDTQGNSLDEESSYDLISKSLDIFEKAYDNLNTVHAKLGSRVDTINTYDDITQSKLTHYKILGEEFASADVTELAIQSQSLENIYTALYSTINKVNKLSLVNYIS